jgi:hypothetical protein
MNINEKTFFKLQNQNNPIKKDNKYYRKCRLYFIYLFIIILLVVDNYILRLKSQNYAKLLTEEKEKKIFYNNNKDELLRMCYKSRTLYFTKNRRQTVESFGMKYDENNLITINDKLNYLLIHESPDYKSKICDKIRLREYSQKKIGKDLCVPIIKIYKDVDDIKLKELPNKFVLKCNHGSGMNILCHNKDNFDLIKAKNNLSEWMNKDYGFESNEFQYINIKRQIFAEKYLGENILDYKVYCFHGNPKFIRVQKKIDDNSKINNYYDLNWSLTDIETGIPNYYRKPEVKFEKPKNLEIMIDYAKKLSDEFVFVRVDFYNINGTIYLGELTFAPSNNQMQLKNQRQRFYLGKFLDISKIKSFLYNN